MARKSKRKGKTMSKQQQPQQPPPDAEELDEFAGMAGDPALSNGTDDEADEAAPRGDHPAEMQTRGDVVAETRVGTPVVLYRGNRTPCGACNRTVLMDKRTQACEVVKVFRVEQDDTGRHVDRQMLCRYCGHTFRAREEIA